MGPLRSLSLAVATLALAACTVEGVSPLEADAAVGITHIEMHDNAFTPAAVEIPAGTTITWAFTDGGRLHNVVGEGFESDVLGDGTFTHTFAAAGTYDYECTLHHGMTGRIVVSDS